MNIECPKCGYDNEVDAEDLPTRACDDADFNCNDCEHTFQIGWIAEVELR